MFICFRKFIDLFQNCWICLQNVGLWFAVVSTVAHNCGVVRTLLDLFTHLSTCSQKHTVVCKSVAPTLKMVCSIHVNIGKHIYCKINISNNIFEIYSLNYIFETMYVNIYIYILYICLLKYGKRLLTYSTHIVTLNELP